MTQVRQLHRFQRHTCAKESVAGNDGERMHRTRPPYVGVRRHLFLRSLPPVTDAVTRVEPSQAKTLELLAEYHRCVAAGFPRTVHDVAQIPMPSERVSVAVPFMAPRLRICEAQHVHIDHPESQTQEA